MVGHVNSIPGQAAAPYRGQSILNCAGCTAAGAVNLTIGTSAISSGMASRALHNVENTMQFGTNHKLQASNISRYVSLKTGRIATRTEDQIPLAEAEKWMLSKPDKTVFAVFARGLVPYDRVSRDHWLNAILAGGTIRYFDFQSMRNSASPVRQFVGHGDPSTSTKPFVGVVTQAWCGANQQSNQQLHGPYQTGSFDGDVKVTVLAFLPG